MSAARQGELYTYRRSAPGPIVTYKRGGESKHNALPSRVRDVALLLAGGEVNWSTTLLGKFARLMKTAEARMHWGDNFPGDFKGEVV